MSEKWTPGPWRVSCDANEHWGMREVIGPAVNVTGFVVATDMTDEKRKRVEADTALIAASPDLAAAAHRIDGLAEAALARLCEMSEAPGDGDDELAGRLGAVLDQLRAALAKARGKTS